MATKTHFTIDQGATFELVLTINDENGDDVNLTGYSVDASFKKTYTSSNSVVFTSNVINNSDILISLTANQTSEVAGGRYVYDVVVTSNSGVVSRLLEGIVTVNPAVTT